MGCATFNTHSHWLSVKEQLDAIGHHRCRYCESGEGHKPDNMRPMFIDNLDEPSFVCGSGIRPCFYCTTVADYLCDYPMGHGKTCDLPLCEEHRVPQGDLPTAPDHCRSHDEAMIYAQPPY